MNLFSRFSQHFRFRLALSEEERTLAFKVRYDVFLRELNYRALLEEPIEHQEIDAYDKKSFLCLVEHRRTRLIAGCMRVVIPHEEAVYPLNVLPLEYHCGNSLTHPSLHPKKLPRKQICEVSRLAVPSHFRRRLEKDDTPPEEWEGIDFTEEEIKIFPIIGVSLFLTATALIGILDRPHVFAMMEPRFARLLALSGLRFQQVGTLMDYQGPRAAYYIDQRQARRDMSSQLRDLYHHIESELAAQYRRNQPS
ncbi:hypothetical protein GCM10007160_27320 [Litchfieldella qijiaojingensis]|uniref:PEP-CTERM/exosortase system-associated acyltransferase n=1 Tax=Litchfieldella qijiaojingensis TaxID=980347 RepID=A0ABQ2YX76_9GAMM|nr:hypothetical protein GCM10007160_27320 [Halomonas qijiaojingensis]